MKEVQSIFKVQIIKTLNLISVVILTINNIFSDFISMRRKMTEFTEEVT